MLNSPFGALFITLGAMYLYSIFLKFVFDGAKQGLVDDTDFTQVHKWTFARTKYICY